MMARKVSDTDSNVAAAWGLTDWQWAFTLTEAQRAEYRLNVAHVIKAGN